MDGRSKMGLNSEEAYNSMETQAPTLLGTQREEPKPRQSS